MTTEDIKNLPVKNITEKNAILFMWCIDSMIPEALAVIEAWGFELKTVGFTWRKLTTKGKEHFGMGFFSRGNPEMCLLATKGKPGRPKNKGVRQLFSSVLREHSRKPDEVYGFIESMYDGPYLELFARNTPRPNWTKLGNELEKLS